MSEPKEFRSQPKPEDWIIPPEFEEQWKAGDGLDPIGLAILKEHEWDGVPIPFGFQTVKVHIDRMRRLNEGESPATIADEMIADWTENERRYPDSGMWDRARGMALTTFIERGNLEEAGRVAAMVTDARLLVRTTLGLEGVIPLETALGLLTGALQAGDQERGIGVARAVRDYLIETEPSDEEMIETFDGIVAMMSSQSDYDMVSDWVASQREVEQGIDWSNTEALLRDEDSYKGMSMPLRMFSHLMFVETLKEIADNEFSDKLADGWAESVVSYYDNAQDGMYADATIWGHELGNIALTLISKGHFNEAVEVAAAIRDSRLGAAMVLEFVKVGHESEAIELAARNPDHKLTAELLLDVEYKYPDAAVAKLSEIVQSDDYPADKRIGCLEVIRDRMLDTGNPDAFIRYQQMIDDIRAEQ